MNPNEASVTTYAWDEPFESTDQVEVLIEALGYHLDEVTYMVSHEEPYVGTSEVEDVLPDFKISKTVKKSPTTEEMGAEAYKASEIMAAVLLRIVESYGDEATQFDVNEFGLTEEEEGDGRLGMVLDFFNNGGAYFSLQLQSCNDGIDPDDKETLLDCFEHYAYQCLYTVIGDDGEKTLKFYRFENPGLVFDDVESEPNHDNVSTLTPEELYRLLKIATGTFCKPSKKRQKR